MNTLRNIKYLCTKRILTSQGKEMIVFEFSFKKIKLSLLIGYEGGVPEKKREKPDTLPQII